MSPYFNEEEMGRFIELAMSQLDGTAEDIPLRFWLMENTHLGEEEHMENLDYAEEEIKALWEDIKYEGARAYMREYGVGKGSKDFAHYIVAVMDGKA